MVILCQLAELVDYFRNGAIFAEQVRKDLFYLMKCTSLPSQIWFKHVSIIV